MARQLSVLPDGTLHVAPFPGSLRDAVEQVAEVMHKHAGPGGFASVVPLEPGVVAVQMFDAHGMVEMFRVMVRGD